MSHSGDEKVGVEGAARFASDAAVDASFVWLFALELEPGAADAVDGEWWPLADAQRAAYDADISPLLAAPLRFFGRAAMGQAGAERRASALVRALQLVRKRRAALTPSPSELSLLDARDASLLDSVFYTYDRPGKGVRSRLVRALAQRFAVPAPTLDNLCSFIEQFHQLSLMIDDIQDGSDLRREQQCAYKSFGIAETLGAAYLQLFRLLADVPQAFPVRSAMVTELVIDGCRVCHRGQALDVTWRERRYW